MRPNFMTRQLQRLIPQIGGSLIVEPNYKCSGCILFDNGVRSFYKESSLDVNPQGAVKVAIDKGYTNFFLQHFGYPIPLYDTFLMDRSSSIAQTKSIAESAFFAKKIGFPVILKPNDGAKGKQVYKTNNRTDYYTHAADIFENNEVLLVQNFVEGNDYRIVVFNNKVYGAYQRLPLMIEGNGKDSIATLIRQKTSALKAKNRRSLLSPDDSRIQSHIEYSKLSYDDILPLGVQRTLLQSANLSLGGIAIDYTKSISPAYQQLAIDISKKMGLRLCGVDIITDSIMGDVQDYSILELNSAPGLSHFAKLSQQAAACVDQLYVDMLLFLKNAL